MKSACLVLLSLVAASDAWVILNKNVASMRSTTTALQAKKNPSWSAGAAAVTLTGWALATQVASAGMPPPVVDGAMTWQDTPSTALAVGAYIPEESYGSLDMSMPKYDTSADDNLLSAPGYSLPGSPGDGGSSGSGGYRIKTVAPKKGSTDPEKARALAQKEAAKRAAKDKKMQETLAKMEAKKAERAAIQAAGK